MAQAIQEGRARKFEFSIGGIKAFAYFLLSWAIASLAFTRASDIADAILGILLVAALTLLVVRKIFVLWRHWDDTEARNAHISAGAQGLFPKWEHWNSGKSSK
jgi:hypothetical protein